MAKITIVGNAIVITSSQKLENIKLLEKYRPKALRLYETGENGKPEEVFRVASTKCGGDINENGATFCGTTHDESKLATITMTIPCGVEDAKKYAAETIGVNILKLNKVEAQFAAAIEAVKAEEAAVMEAITVQ